MIKQNLLLLALLLAATLAYFAYTSISSKYRDPQKVFWGMVNQNLQTATVGRLTKSDDPQQYYRQLTQLQFKSILISESTITISEQSNGVTNKVVTKAVGTADSDYLKYLEITKDNKPASQNAVNVWAVQNKAKSQEQPTFLAESLLSSPLMFGYFNKDIRQQLANDLKNSEVYKIDFQKTNKQYNFNDKTVFAYNVNINVAKYIEVYKKYLNKIGQVSLAEQLNQPASTDSYQTILLINPTSLQPVATMVGDSTDEYVNFDTNNQIEYPKDAKLSFSELRDKL